MTETLQNVVLLALLFVFVYAVYSRYLLSELRNEAAESRRRILFLTTDAEKREEVRRCLEEALYCVRSRRDHLAMEKNKLVDGLIRAQIDKNILDGQLTDATMALTKLEKLVPLTAIDGIGDETAAKLRKRDITTVKQIAGMSQSKWDKIAASVLPQKNDYLGIKAQAELMFFKGVN